MKTEATIPILLNKLLPVVFAACSKTEHPLYRYSPLLFSLFLKKGRRQETTTPIPVARYNQSDKVHHQHCNKKLSVLMFGYHQ